MSSSDDDDDLITALRRPLYEAVSDASTGVALCSPFIGPGVAARLESAASHGTADWRLLTYVNARAAAYGSLSLDGLERLLAKGVSIRSLPGLHAKLFLIDDSIGFVGSANLTTSGLGGDERHNRELSVALNQRQQLAALKQFELWWGLGADVDTTTLRECRREARKVHVSLAGETPSVGNEDLLEVANDLLRVSESVQTWIKAVYRDAQTADAPWSTSPWVGSPDAGRPGFAVGDLLLIYAKAAQRCNAVLQVVGVSRRDPDFALAHGISAEHAARWPWITPIEVRMQVPVASGVPLARLGVTGQSLQSGHRRMPVGGLAVALRYLAGVRSAEE